MEQHNQPRGAANEITSRAEQYPLPTDVPIYEAEVPDTRPPVTFIEAVAHNPFKLLTELHDHAMALRLHDKPPTFHLTELALSAAVVAWWSRWQPIAMHRALAAGAGLAEVAAAAGTTKTEAYERWSRWANEQTQLMVGDRPAVDPEQVAAIVERLHLES